MSGYDLQGPVYLNTFNSVLQSATRPSKAENGTSDIIPGLCSHRFGYLVFC